MESETYQQRKNGTNPLLWLAGAGGAAIGVAALLYSRRRRSRWEVVKQQAGKIARTSKSVAQKSAEDFKPWMGITAGAAAAGVTSLAFLRARRRSPWQRAGERATRMASQKWVQIRPWAGLAAS